MKDFDLLRSLQAHTGNLQPASGVTHAELNELRRLVMLSVSSGQSPEEIGTAGSSTRSLDTPLLKELEWLASTEALSAPRPAESFRIARRDFGLGGPLTAEWARGLEPAQTLGPFVDEFGRQSWFDLFLIPKQFRVSRGNELLLILPPATTKRPNAQALTIAAGTVWIRANQLTSGVLPAAWTGVRVKGGQIEIPRGANLTNNALVIDVASPLNLQIELDPPSATGPATGPGSEATNATVNLPATARFTFGPLGVETIETGAASSSVYGNDLTFTRNAVPQSFEPTLRMVLISMVVDRANFDIGTTTSKLFQPAGSALIEKAAWGLPVTISQPEQLGVAEGAGSLVLITKDGLTGTWNGLPAEQTSLGSALIAVSPISLILLAQKSTNFRAQQTFELWQETPSRRSTIDVHFPRPFFFSFVSSRNGLDSIAFQSQLIAHLDRPVRVDGSRFPVDLTGMVILLENSTGTTVAMDANALRTGSPKPMAVALTNGLVTITPVQRLLVNGTLLDNVNIDKGTLTITSGIYQVLPILPDPYAANFESRGTQDSPLSDTLFRAVITWPDPPRPSLDIALESPNGGLTQMLPRANRAGGERNTGNFYSLLDVSSSADQLGVSMAVQSGRIERPDSQRLTVQSLSIHYPADHLATFLLPQFQWEPVENTNNPDTGDTEGRLTSDNDGGPSSLRSDSVHLVPVAPVPVVREVVRTYKDEGASVNVNFTLPFGITASAALRDRRYMFPPSLELLRVGFEDLRGARQISLWAGRQFNPDRGSIVARLDPVLFGKAQQTPNFVNPPPDNTLGQLRMDFDAEFKDQIPIQRIEFSGYGASIFSRWVRPGDPDVGITQVSFDAFNGRTSFERILMVSYLWPCLSRVIRTIVLERQGSGSVLRWDSGWVATTPGHFSLQGKFEHIHKGDVDGMYNIREIRDTKQITTLANGKALEAVYYDADLAFTPVGGIPIVESGQNKAGLVPVRRQLGFIQRLSLLQSANPGQRQADLLSRQEFDELLQTVGPLGGPIDCRIRIGKSQQRKRVTLIQTERAGNDGGPVFAVPLYGSPVIRGSGQWSIVNVDNGSRNVQPVDMKRGVPLIKRNNREYRWADAIDLINPEAAQRDYAFLMAHDAQRFLLQRPKIEVNATNISSTQPPRVADPYSMLESSGLFPRIDQAINLPVGTELIAETLKLATTNGALTHNVASVQKTLLNLPSWTERVDFTGAQLFIDSFDNWKINLSGLKQKVDFGPLKEIMTLVHDFESVADQTSKLLEPKVVFPELLQAVADVLDLLNSLAPDRAGGVGPFKVNPQFHGTTFKLEIVADFKLATKDEDQIECGMGKVRGNLKVGAELTADLIKREIGGAVFLEISGSWQQLIFPAIYGGGHLRFFIRADHDGKTHLELDACVIGSIGGTLIPNLVDLEATVKYGYYIQVTDKPLPGVIVGMEGRANLLSGLLGFKFGVEGRALIDPHIPPDVPDLEDRAVTLYGRIRVAGTVTLAWAIKESKSFETDFNVDVTWKTALAAAKFGLLPVP